MGRFEYRTEYLGSVEYYASDEHLGLGVSGLIDGENSVTLWGICKGECNCLAITRAWLHDGPGLFSPTDVHHWIYDESTDDYIQPAWKGNAKKAEEAGTSPAR